MKKRKELYLVLIKIKPKETEKQKYFLERLKIQSYGPSYRGDVEVVAAVLLECVYSLQVAGPILDAAPRLHGNSRLQMVVAQRQGYNLLHCTVNYLSLL